MMSKAVNHLLEQIKRDPRLAYLIGPGSQSYELLIQEGAAHAGRDVDECRAEFEKGLRYEPWPSELSIQDRINAAIEARMARQISPARITANFLRQIAGTNWRGFELRELAACIEKGKRQVRFDPDVEPALRPDGQDC